MLRSSAKAPPYDGPTAASSHVPHNHKRPARVPGHPHLRPTPPPHPQDLALRSLPIAHRVVPFRQNIPAVRRRRFSKRASLSTRVHYATPMTSHPTPRPGVRGGPPANRPASLFPSGRQRDPSFSGGRTSHHNQCLLDIIQHGPRHHREGLVILCICFAPVTSRPSSHPWPTASSSECTSATARSTPAQRHRSDPNLLAIVVFDRTEESASSPNVDFVG